MLRRVLGAFGFHAPLGRRGERIAARYLKRRGYRVLARNVRAPMGEIDLICEAPRGREIVVVEVKTRLEGDHERPRPAASITRHKRAKLVALAKWARRANGWEDRPLRIDAVAVVIDRRGRARVTHIENAVDAVGNTAR
ncbi:MAG: YraN family protein [Phycisphaerales bacterium]